MIYTIVISLALMNAAPNKDAAFPLFGKDKTETAKIEELHKQTGLINADLTLMKARLDKIELALQAQAGLVNKIQENSGSQYFVGDVGALSISGIALLFVVLIIAYFRYQIAVHKSAGLILASSKNDEEALEKAKQAPEKVKTKVEELVEEKNTK